MSGEGPEGGAPFAAALLVPSNSSSLNSSTGTAPSKGSAGSLLSDAVDPSMDEGFEDPSIDGGFGVDMVRVRCAFVPKKKILEIETVWCCLNAQQEIMR